MGRKKKIVDGEIIPADKKQACVGCGGRISAQYHVPCCKDCREYPELYDWAAKYSVECEKARHEGREMPPLPPRPLCQRRLF